MEKIDSEMRRQITEIIRDELDDPNIGVLSITKVETTSDLTESKVYFSLLDDTKYKKVQSILDRMAKFIRFNLGKRIIIKILPQLTFIPDDSIKYSVDIYSKIEEVKQRDEELQAPKRPKIKRRHE
ncbi:MAG: 30S ribosome-binding factor RbfA [Candidatus Omnitrophota bacterium]|nr:30S ribosome-binding factor RbfA [Candidatus Omnitrophota bacterium]